MIASGGLPWVEVRFVMTRLIDESAPVKLYEWQPYYSCCERNRLSIKLLGKSIIFFILKRLYHLQITYGY
jgi:hypothetical protein